MKDPPNLQRLHRRPRRPIHLPGSLSRSWPIDADGPCGIRAERVPCSFRSKPEARMPRAPHAWAGTPTCVWLPKAGKIALDLSLNSTDCKIGAAPFPASSRSTPVSDAAPATKTSQAHLGVEVSAEVTFREPMEEIANPGCVRGVSLKPDFPRNPSGHPVCQPRTNNFRSHERKPPRVQANSRSANRQSAAPCCAGHTGRRRVAHHGNSVRYRHQGAPGGRRHRGGPGRPLAGHCRPLLRPRYPGGHRVRRAAVQVRRSPERRSVRDHAGVLRETPHGRRLEGPHQRS